LEKQPLASLANRDEIKAYWGYRVTISEIPLGQLIKNKSFDLVIATSRRGTSFMKVVDELAKRWKKSRKILVALGAPAQGLHEILAREHLKLNKLSHFTVNTIPDQGCKTVRTEEALYASLAILNLIVDK
jgi:predicted SPOUT superfamily RNA methylase MTH1